MIGNDAISYFRSAQNCVYVVSIFHEKDYFTKTPQSILKLSIVLVMLIQLLRFAAAQIVSFCSMINRIGPIRTFAKSRLSAARSTSLLMLPIEIVENY